MILPAGQDTVCIVRVAGRILPKLYFWNGFAWYRADGDYEAKSRVAPGRIETNAVEDWRDFTAMRHALSSADLPNALSLFRLNVLFAALPTTTQGRTASNHEL